MTQISVPLLDLKAQYNTLRDEIEPVVRRVIEDQWFIMGPEVKSLEEEVAAYTGVRHAIGCASGTDAILLACMAMGIGPGDEVIVPTYTFFATAGSVSRLGATPVFADIDPVTYNMDIEHTRRLAAGCKNLKAIMPVHLFGQACDMAAWTALGEELGVPVIEDAAQAIGTKDSDGVMTGNRGAAGCFSFFPSKNLGCFGDGGLVTTNDDEIADKVNILRLHGSRPKYYHSIVGLNSRLDALQAAVLRVKLRHLESWHDARNANADVYDRLFTESGALTNATPIPEDWADRDELSIRTPTRPIDGKSRHVFNQYVLRVPAPLRDPLREHLKANNIGNEVYYPVPLHLQECFADLGGKPGDLPHAERAAAETIALPIYPELTDEQQRYVAETVVSFVRANARAAAGV